MSEYLVSRHVLDLRGRKPGLHTPSLIEKPTQREEKSYRALLTLSLILITGITSTIYALGVRVGAELDTESVRPSQVQQNYTASVSGAVYPAFGVDRSVSLQEVLEEAVQAEPGEISVLVESLEGDVFSAGVGVEKKYNPYSTYKLFIAWLVLERVDKREWELAKPVFEGRDVGECVEDMIVLSDNKCPETFFKMLGGREVIERRVQREGFSNTSFVGELGSTVTDQVAFLKKLYRGELLGWSGTEYLLELMKRQKFRDGVPLGVSVPVADKVGFLHGYLHDSAIVYGEESTYTVSIYTKDSSWASIARIAKKVHAFLEE